MQRLRPNLFTPAGYHGQQAKSPFFEGWYFKLIDRSGQHRYAVIPGIFLTNEPHAFVQLLDGVRGTAVYHRYPLNQFSAAADRLDVRVGPNHFTAEQISLDLAGQGPAVRGRLTFDPLTPWPVTLRSPGVMGWYAYVPRMECYHGVLSLDHGLHGQLAIDGATVDFTGGRGYIEKDWGESFPSAYVWLQSNHFQQAGTSLTGSIATIPWVRQSFRGFIVGFWHQKQLYRFATYTGAETDRLAIDDDQVIWHMSDKAYRLELIARRAEGGLLKGPTRDAMSQRVPETLSATVNVRLFARRRGGELLLFWGDGRFAGLEVVGHMEELTQ